MAQIITNQARVDFEYNGQSGFAVSNIASATLRGPLGVSKNALEETYRSGRELTYVVSVRNNGGVELTNITVSDDLGTETLGGGSVTPLTFVPPAALWIDSVFSGILPPTLDVGAVTFTIPSLPAGSSAVIVYRAAVNVAAPLTAGSSITNTVTVSAAGLTRSVTASYTVTVEEYADVRITKSMMPEELVSGDSITYRFVVYNYGNTPVNDIVLMDDFDPAPENITVEVNGAVISPADYTYSGGRLTLPTGGRVELSLPAARITRNEETGFTQVEPSSMVITVRGMLV